MTVINPNLFARTGDEDFSSYIKALVSGAPKSGKTALLGTVPGILMCDTEPDANNMETVRHLDLPVATIRSSQDLKDVAITLGNDVLRQQLAQQYYGLDDIYAVSIDTTDTLQKILKKERMADQKSRTFERDDWGWLKTEMEQIIETFTSLPLHVFFTVHLKTSDIGSGKDRWSKVEPGLEGAIASSIAGMVGYSIMTFRQEDVDEATGHTTTTYWVRTEGNKTHDFLGTRTGIRGLPTVIPPDMGVIHGAIQAGKAAVAAARAARAELPAAEPLHYPELPAPGVQGQLPPGYPGGQVVQGQVLPPQATTASPQTVTVAPSHTTATPPNGTVAQPVDPVQSPAQTVSQEESVQTPVQTPEAAQPVAQPVAQQPAPDGRPADTDLVNVTALGHLKRIFDACRLPFPDEVLKTKTMGEAREISTTWKAIMQDHAEGKAPQGTTQESDMTGVLKAKGLVTDEPAAASPAEKPVMAVLDINGNLADIKGYVGNPPDLARVQEVYDAETAKGDKARKTLVQKMVDFGAKPPAPDPVAEEPDPWAPPVQTPVQQSTEAVTPPAASTDTHVTGAALDPAQQPGAVRVEEVVIQVGTPCDVCGDGIDDVDLAELGVNRFKKILCVPDYLAQSKK